MRRRPWAFDIAFTALVVALLGTATVLVADLVCRVYIGQPYGCDWPSAADGGTDDDDER